MSSKTKKIIKYFRSAVAAQSNMGIDFKKDDYQMIIPQEVLRGEMNLATCEAIFADSNKDADDGENEMSKKNDRNKKFGSGGTVPLLPLEEKMEKAMATFDFVGTGYCFDTSPGRIIYFSFNPERFWKYIRPVRK